jgi:hypothetical protein
VLSLAKVRTLVLDEADRMLDMSFEEPIREIVGHTPPSRQSLLLSATYPEAIRKMVRGTLRDPLEVTVAAQRSTRSHRAMPAPMSTLRIDGGRGDKLRPCDILGALTGDAGLPSDAIGKIDVFATRAYVAIPTRSPTRYCAACAPARSRAAASASTLFETLASARYLSGGATRVACQVIACHFPLRRRNVPLLRK